jgi:hypothetical protein
MKIEQIIFCSEVSHIPKFGDEVISGGRYNLMLRDAHLPRDLQNSGYAALLCFQKKLVMKLEKFFKLNRSEEPCRKDSSVTYPALWRYNHISRGRCGVSCRICGCEYGGCASLKGMIHLQ